MEVSAAAALVTVGNGVGSLLFTDRGHYRLLILVPFIIKVYASFCFFEDTAALGFQVHRQTEESDIEKSTKGRKQWCSQSADPRGIFTKG